MKKLVRVIRLQPGESVLIVSEDKPDPCGCICMMEEGAGKGTVFTKGFLIYLDEAA